ncbi:ATP-binding protein [Pseudomonas aeruginosa]
MNSATQPWLTGADREWLAAHTPLTVGVSEPSYAPLGIVAGSKYQGVTADYLSLLLPATPHVRLFPSRQAALEALRKGEVDLVGGGTALEATQNHLLLSPAYSVDQPVLITRRGRPFESASPAPRIAVVTGHRSESQVKAAYPGSQVLLYASPRLALSALTVGDVDAVIGDALSAHYLITIHYLVNLQIENFAPLPGNGFGFLVRPDETKLYALLQQAVPKISAAYGDDILRTWSAGRELYLRERRITLTPEENRWIVEHPVVPVVINDAVAALTQQDQQGRVGGIGPDYLDLLGQRSGLKFSYQKAENEQEVRQMLRDGKALVAPALSPNPQEDAGLELLTPYLHSSVVLMTRRTMHPGIGGEIAAVSLQDLRGGSLATAQGYFMNAQIERDYPDIQLKVFPDFEDAMRSVDDGDADAFIGSEYTGRFLSAQRFNNRLRVSGILNDVDRPISVAVVATEPVLAGILEKAQMAVGPDEVADVVRQWEPRFTASGLSFWRDHRESILQLIGVFVLAIAISLIWGFYLTRQVRRRRQVERQLQVEREKADSANQAKSVFLSTMSHEIRTPLNAIIGMHELVLEKAEQGELDKDMLNVAQDAARGLLLLLGNVLDLARIESGRVDSAPEPSCPSAEIEGVIPLVVGMARRKGLSLETQLSGAVEQWVMLDRLHFKQVLFNLLSNAIKFTSAGSVTIRAHAKAEATRLRLVVEIVDTGLGISPQDQAKLFQPFAQVEEAQAGQTNGTGLGLSISRRLVGLLGGSLALESELGKGSLFRITLLLPKTDAPPSIETPVSPPPPVSPGAALNVLAVDDNLFNRMTMHAQLTRLGHRVTQAEDGEKAFELWRLGDFDVVITDGQMPVMNGYDLARQIREDEEQSHRAPCRIVGCTASAERKESHRGIEAGMDTILFKPITLEQLDAALRGSDLPANSPE